MTQQNGGRNIFHFGCRSSRTRCVRVRTTMHATCTSHKQSFHDHRTRPARSDDTGHPPGTTKPNRPARSKPLTPVGAPDELPRTRDLDQICAWAHKATSQPCQAHQTWTRLLARDRSKQPPTYQCPRLIRSRLLLGGAACTPWRRNILSSHVLSQAPGTDARRLRNAGHSVFLLMPACPRQRAISQALTVPYFPKFRG